MYIFLFIFVKECYNLGSPLVAQRKTKRKRKTCLQMKEMWIQSLDQEDLREEEIATHSNSLVWAIPWTKEHGGLHFSSVTQSCQTLCNPMDCSMPGFPVHHQLPEFTQTHVHWVGDAIQPSHPLSSPSPPTFNQNVVDWRREWQTTSVFLPWEPHEQYEKGYTSWGCKKGQAGLSD